MWNRKTTIRMRASILSLLIMLSVVLLLVIAVYILEFALNPIAITTFDLQTNNEDLAIHINQLFLEKKQNLFFQLVLTSIGILCFGSYAIYSLLKKELKPLELLRNKIIATDFNSNNNQIQLESLSTEITTLTDAFNEMIEKLQSAYISQKRFSQNAAHELKTPIATMKTTLQVARMTNRFDKCDANETLDTLEHQITRMSLLVQNLLRLNTIGQLKFISIDVRMLIENCLLALQTQIEHKKIQVTVTGELQLISDEGLLTLILNNIIENAIKYNKDHGQIIIDLSDQIVISDTGIGIPQQELDKIFDPFYCVDDSRSKALGGFGFGLTMVKEGLQRLSYQYSVISTLDAGTTFAISPKNPIVKA